MDAVRRFKVYLDEKGISINNAEVRCGVANSTFRKAFTNGGTLKSDNIEKILNVYPDLSAEWLLRGTGNMFVGEGINTEQMFKALNMPPNSDKIIDVWMKFMEVTQGMQNLYRQSKSSADGI